MDATDKKIGNIKYKGIIYEVIWNLQTKDVKCINQRGEEIQYGDAKAQKESEVLNCAKSMLETSGL